MTFKLMMFLKIYFKIKNYLIILITQKNNEFFFDENKKIIGKMKFDNSDYPKTVSSLLIKIIRKLEK